MRLLQKLVCYAGCARVTVFLAFASNTAVSCFPSMHMLKVCSLSHSGIGRHVPWHGKPSSLLSHLFWGATGLQLPTSHLSLHNSSRGARRPKVISKDGDAWRQQHQHGRRAL